MVIEPRHNILPPLKINHSISQCSVFIRVSQGRHATVFPGGAARRQKPEPGKTKKQAKDKQEGLKWAWCVGAPAAPDVVIALSVAFGGGPKTGRRDKTCSSGARPKTGRAFKHKAGELKTGRREVRPGRGPAARPGRRLPRNWML